MPYGIIKVDTVTFTDNGVDKNISLSGLVQNPTFTGNVTATGTISGDIIRGGTTVSGLTVTGTTANFASGVFTTQVSGTTITGATVVATTGNFTSLTGTTTTGTTANFVSGVFSTQVSGATIIAPTGTFTSLTGTTTTGTTANFVSGVFSTQVSGATITGTTVATTTGTFVSLTGTTATFTSGIIASGTAALPSLAILSDPNTGIFSPGADQLAISTNGTSRLSIDASGNIAIDTNTLYVDAVNNQVGFGTTSTLNGANAQFSLGSGASSAPYFSIFNTASTPTSAASTRLDLGFLSGASNYNATATTLGTVNWMGQGNDYGYGGAFIQAVVTSGGNVGRESGHGVNLIFGTKPTNTAGSEERLRIRADGMFEVKGAGVSGSSPAFSVNGSAPANSAVIDSSGRLGIGNSSPGSFSSFANNLVVGTGTGANGITIYAGNASTSSLNFADGTSGNDLFPGYIMYNHANDSLSFVVNYAGSSPARMFISSAGLVGIGSTSPSAKLDVVGSHATNLSSLFLRNTSATNTATTLSFYSYINYNGGITGAGSEISAETTFATDTGTSQMVFKTTSNITYLGPQEKMRLDASGRLLVGTSTSASTGSFAQYAFLQVKGNTSNAASSAIFNLQRGEGAATITTGEGLGLIDFTDNAGNSFGFIACDADGTAGAGDFPGCLVFSTTADGGSSPTERMKITSAGFFCASSTGSFAATTRHNFTWNASERFQLNHTSATATDNFGIEILYSATPNNTGQEFLRFADSTALRATIRSNGGLANFQANDVNLSDINTKKDISLAADTWDCVKKWEIVNYRYKDQHEDADLNIGVIAQQVAESCPEVITAFQEATEDEPEKLGVKEQQMYWMAIKALQEAIAKIETLEQRLTAAGID